MRRDKNAPALYELVKGRTLSRIPPKRAFSLRSRAKKAPPPPPPPEDEFDDEEETSWVDWLRPGRIVKLPIGYLFFALAAVLLLTLTAYMVGYKTMEARSDALRRADAQREFRPPTDPLVRLQLADPGPAASTPVPTVAASPVAARPTAQPPATTSASNAGPRVVDVASSITDPRTPELNYLVAATLPEDEARRAADFLVSKGLAIALVPANNRSSRREVIVLRGITREQYRQGELRLQIEERVKMFGREFARELRGGDDFSSCWWKKHTG